VQCLLPK